MRFLNAATVIVAISSASIAGGQTAPAKAPAAPAVNKPFRVIGTFDELSGEPLGGVEVIETATGTEVMTSSTGSANLGLIVPKGGEIRLRKIGFEEQTMTVAMSAADTVPISVMMKHVAELPAVVARSTAPRYRTAALQAFEARRKNHSAGYFIDDSTLRKLEYKSLASVLVDHAPGSVIKPSGSATFLLKSPRCVNGGQPDVFIDGAPLAHLQDWRWQPPNPKTSRTSVSDPRETPIDLSQFPVSTLAGVEYYPDNTTLPAEFGRITGSCGALFLWTREK